MFFKLLKIILNPYPHRTFAIWAAKKIKLGSYRQRLTINAVDRPHYGYCLYHAAESAVKLGLDEIAVLEFGVAGGNGLVNIEYHVREIENILPVKIRIFGFDTGKGLPEPKDYRDLPYRFKGKAYKMDENFLRERLEKAVLVLGDVSDTVKTFFKSHTPPPIAAIFFDLDYYSSTRDALTIFDAGSDNFLPRVYCYFDDILGTELELYNDFVGERLAIREFNQSHPLNKISQAYQLQKHRVVESWHHRIFVYHDFDHPLYNRYIGEQDENGFVLNSE